jgi:hypothetical protein
MSNDTVMPAPATTGVDRFLASTLATVTPAPAPAASVVSTDAKPEPSAAAVPAPVVPSGDVKKTDAPAVPPTIETVMKQLGEQTTANKKLGRSNIELLQQSKAMKAELAALRAHVEGTASEPAKPTPEQDRALIEFQAREAASRKVAEEKYGADFIKAQIFDEESPYRQLIGEHPWIHQRVMGSDTPILEALDALNEHQVLSTYGKTAASVLENVSKAVKEQLWNEWTQAQQKTTQPQAGASVSTLGDARGETGGTTGKPAAPFTLDSFNRHIP